MVSLSWLFGSSKPASDGDNNSTKQTPAIAQTQALPPPPEPTPAPPSTTLPQEPPPEPNHFFSKRSLRQLGLFFGGAGFFYWSLLLSRRAITRHQLAAQLKFYQPNQFGGRAQLGSPGRRDPLVAVEALNLATLNTISFAIMAAGGVSWAFDISTMDDLRRITRRSLEAAAGGTIDEAAEQEVAAWFAKTLGIVEKEKEKGQFEGNGKR
ncbi:6dcc02c9-9c58-426b-91fc-9169048b2c92 [Thermothielavioides terrestris]|uniref:Altered inheritance of mitochondria protein 11 n=2 Tax=Thermothielavioides terrestris TaxID=2587410 RepID=G2R3P0_THETT|nr:uncharacterized protein THITE_2111837 [Thermothielavioides terrestris NRRL 8126]AEO65140.1 hypothetical protein THITE_2111837 [Thermothielavioides terrestris NRRL 8126]SPQ19607.1 6dcc02c9-9c58-426b-91fc-9169048b2c92 [Thermothielavioides terrestris]